MACHWSIRSDQDARRLQLTGQDSVRRPQGCGTCVSILVSGQDTRRPSAGMWHSACHLPPAARTRAPRPQGCFSLPWRGLLMVSRLNENGRGFSTKLPASFRCIWTRASRSHLSTENGTPIPPNPSRNFPFPLSQPLSSPRFPTRFHAAACGSAHLAQRLRGGSSPPPSPVLAASPRLLWRPVLLAAASGRLPSWP